MGSSIVTNRLAAVFENPHNRGDQIWVLFEAGYESNVYPHSASWCARSIGRMPETMRVIFRDAAHCEGGSLRDRKGSITPETYIRRWYRALRHPVQMPQMDIRVRREDLRSSFRMPDDPTDDERWENFCTRMRSLGREDIPLALDAGTPVVLSLYADIELVLAIYGSSPDRSPLLALWKAFGSSWAPEKAPKAEVGYYPPGGQIPSPEIPRAYRINDNALVMPEEGTWRDSGWAYSVVGEYVRGLWETELRAPGSFEVLIPPYREAIGAAQLVPEGSEAVVDLSQCRRPEDVRELVAFAGGRIEQDPERGTERAVLPWSMEASVKLAYLPSKATEWRVPEVPAAEGARLCA